MKLIARALNYLAPRLEIRVKKIKARYLRVRLGNCGAGLTIWGQFTIKNPEKVHAGHNLSINDYVYINALGGIYIGNNVSLSAACMLISTKLDKHAIPFNTRHINQPIRIGNNVQIGAGAIILPGVTINDNVIVGAGAIVSKNAPKNTIVRSRQAECFPNSTND